MDTKYIFVTGGVASSLGKGIIAASLAKLLQARGLRVNKPYVRPIVRGKEIKKVEFGAKCNNILIDGMSFIEKLSFNAFNEGTRLVHCVKLAEKLFGEKITKIGGDCSYSGNDNRTFCSDENIV